MATHEKRAATEGVGGGRRAEGGSIYRCSQRAPAQLVIIKTAGIIRRPFPRFFRPQPERAQKRSIPTQICCCRTVGHSRLQREKITVFFIQHSSFIQTVCSPAEAAQSVPPTAFHSAFSLFAALILSKLRHFRTSLCRFEARRGTKRRSVTQPTDSRPHKTQEELGIDKCHHGNPHGG